MYLLVVYKNIQHNTFVRNVLASNLVASSSKSFVDLHERWIWFALIIQCFDFNVEGSIFDHTGA
jgi:hypothetical protein